MKWTDDAVRDEVIALARTSQNRTELRRKLMEKTGEDITSDMLRGAWNRWQVSHGVRPIDEVIGSSSGHLDDDDEVIEEFETKARQQKIKFPRNTAMPDPCPDHLVRVDLLPRNLLSDGDTHHPYQDPYVENAKLKFAQDVKPDVWVNVGDAYDFWMLSTHEKIEVNRIYNGRARLQEEFNSAKPYWKEVCRVTRKEVHYIIGNHENRLHRFIGANVWAYELDAFEWHALAGLPAKVRVHEYAAQVRVGPLNFEHGDRVCPNTRVEHPAAVALKNRPQRNVIFGHSHRFETKVRAYYDGINSDTHISINQGHGTDVKLQVYAGPEPNWSHGFTYFEFYTDNGKPRFTAYPIVIVNGKFTWGGKLYDGHKI